MLNNLYFVLKKSRRGLDPPPPPDRGHVPLKAEIFLRPPFWIVGHMVKEGAKILKAGLYIL